jgi:hypothetical protein
MEMIRNNRIVFFPNSLPITGFVTRVIRRMLTHDKSSHGLWPGELKVEAQPTEPVSLT